MNINVLEYQNQNRYRKYPFLDNASLQATNGVLLPTDFIIDAVLYPIDLENSLYVKSVNFADREITLADTVTDAVHGVAEWSATDTVAYVYEDNTYARMVGILVLGDGRNNQSVGGTLTFVAAATQFTPAAVFTLNQDGVRGIVLEDGTLFTGKVKFEGRNGVVVDSFVDAEGHSVISFAVSAVPDPVEMCFDCRMIQCIRIVTSSGSHLIASAAADNSVYLTTTFELSAICPPSNIKLPSQRTDPCVEVVPCEDITPGAADETTICPIHGRLYFIAPSPVGYDNPLQISAHEDPAPAPDYNSLIKSQGLSQESRETLLQQMFDSTALSRGKLVIGYRVGHGTNLVQRYLGVRG